MFTLLVSSFILGIISNLHCIGMCGPIALAIPINRQSKFTMLFGILQYNFGRVFTYSILGFIVGFIGIGMNLIGILQSISIITGIGIILYAWRKTLFNGKIFQYLNFLQKFTSKNMGRILSIKNPFKLFLLGMLNGLLPCGMVYSALIAAIISGTPIHSSLMMIFFGLGTLPGMISIIIFTNQLSNRFRGKINKIFPYLATIVGLLIIIRGLNLDIPYFSPQAKQSEKTKEVEMSCCHKNAKIYKCKK